MPSELPETLPIGTCGEIPGEPARTAPVFKPAHNGHLPGYWALWGNGTRESFWQPQCIDWSKVPRQPKSAPVGCETICPDGKRCELRGPHDRHMTSVTMTCPPQPSAPERHKLKRDPYVCHRESMASILSGSAYERGGVLEQSIAFQTAKKDSERLSRMTPPQRRRAEALAALGPNEHIRQRGPARRLEHYGILAEERRTGRKPGLDKYGQKLSLKGWPEVDE